MRLSLIYTNNNNNYEIIFYINNKTMKLYAIVRLYSVWEFKMSTVHIVPNFKLVCKILNVFFF